MLTLKTLNNVDNSLSFVHDNSLTQNQNASFTFSMECGTNNILVEGDNTGNNTVVSLGNNVSCLITQTQIGNITDNSQNNLPGLTSPSSIADVEQPLAKTQQINPYENDNGISIPQQGNQIDVMKSQSSKTSPTTIAQGIGNPPELTATEKIEKLKAQYVELYQ
jgi:hypothetical protein